MTATRKSYTTVTIRLPTEEVYDQLVSEARTKRSYKGVTVERYIEDLLAAKAKVLLKRRVQKLTRLVNEYDLDDMPGHRE